VQRQNRKLYLFCCSLSNFSSFLIFCQVHVGFIGVGDVLIQETKIKISTHGVMDAFGIVYP